MSSFTPVQIRESGDAVGGRTAPVRREVLRLLQQDLPGQIALTNSLEGLNLPAVLSFRFGRPVLTNVRFPAVFVDARTRVQAIAPRVVKRLPQIEVYFVAGTLEDATQSDDYLDIAELIELVLKPRQSGHLLPSGAGLLGGLRAWNTLDCESISPLPEKWSSHAGHVVSFIADQAGCKLWPR